MSATGLSGQGKTQAQRARRELAVGLHGDSQTGGLYGQQANRNCQLGALWEGWEALQSKLDGFLAAKDLMAQGIKI